MFCADVLAKHARFCLDNCAAYERRATPPWCGHERMHRMHGRPGQAACPWPLDTIQKHGGSK